MPSDKCNSITAKAMGLSFIPFNINSFGDVPFRLPKHFESWFYQSLPLFSFVLHSFLNNCVGNDSQYGFGAQDLGKHSAGRGTFYIILCLRLKSWK